MNRYFLTIAAIVFCASFARPAAAYSSCSVEDIAGNWVFATSIGRQSLGGPFPPDKDITAIGTMKISRDGTLSGSFDTTIEDDRFLPGLGYSGVVVVNPDCTGTVSFNTDAGTTRTDSIVVVNRREILAMSQDPLNLWTYEIRRTAANHRRDERDDD